MHKEYEGQCPFCKNHGTLKEWHDIECQKCGFHDSDQVAEFIGKPTIDHLSNDVRQLQAEIKEWADGVFPTRTWFGALSKIVMEEIPELLSNPDDPLEYADLFIILLDLADMKGIDLQDAVRRKLEINRGREWCRDPQTGFLKHIGNFADQARVIEAEGFADDELALAAEFNRIDEELRK